MNFKKFVRTVIGFITLSGFLFIIQAIDFAILYSIFLYFQFLLAPLLTGFGHFLYILRLSLPYICMYILICLFFNIQSYRTSSTIKLLKYTIDVNAVRRHKLYIYLRQYNYVLIIAFNLILLFIVYYAYINHKYFYLLFIFLFYLSIWIIIKVKHLLFKNEALQYKKVHMLVNVILVVLIGTYVSMALEDFHISNTKLYGFENFWKLIDNKYFIKMPLKDFNWNRIFNWSKQVSKGRYMSVSHKNSIKSQFWSEDQQQLQKIDNNLLSPQNDDLNLNIKSKNLLNYLNKSQYENQNLGKFSNAMYQKFKKVFLMQLRIKPSNFIPTTEMNGRQKLFYWLKRPYNFIDLSKDYTSPTDSPLYENYLDLVDKKFNNLTTKKVFLITLHKNYSSLKSIAFFVEFENSFKKNYVIFLNSAKDKLDLKDNSILSFEYYNDNLYSQFEFKNFFFKFKSDLYIVFQENKRALSLFSTKFKSLYTIKKFKFNFKEDVIDDLDLLYNMKPKVKNYLMIPDFKKLQVWRTFKLNYKEILYDYKRQVRNYKFDNFENKWLFENKLKVTKEPFKEIFFVVQDDIEDDDIIYSLFDYNKLIQVEDLILNDEDEIDLTSLSVDEALTEYITYYLENIKTRSNAKYFASTKKFTKILIKNDLDKKIIELQDNRVHVPTYSSMYHEILLQNSNKFFKYILENFDISRDLLTSSRAFMTFDMWCSTMQKLLNLNTDSLCLNNLKDFSDFCKSDFTDDLQFNFSIAFDLLQHKYDLNNLFLIPDLEGIPGTFYEYTVKYHQHMAKYYWYEEQEALIDWFYEISYYSLVDIMDTVKEVDGRENDFLYDMINQYSREPKYKWAAEMFESREIDAPSKQLILLNKKLAVLNDLYDMQDRKHLIQLSDKKDLHHLKLINNKLLMDFDNIDSFKQLNWKVGKDLSVLENIFKWQLHHRDELYVELVDDFTTLHHTDYH